MKEKMEATKVIYERFPIDVKEITLLTLAKYKAYKERVPRSFDGAWWLRTPAKKPKYAKKPHMCVVDYKALVDTRPIDESCGVRPAMVFEADRIAVGDSFELFDWGWTVIADGLAICNQVVYNCAFQGVWNEVDADCYETSLVKWYLDRWLADAKSKR